MTTSKFTTQLPGKTVGLLAFVAALAGFLSLRHTKMLEHLGVTIFRDNPSVMTSDLMAIALISIFVCSAAFVATLPTFNELLRLLDQNRRARLLSLIVVLASTMAAFAFAKTSFPPYIDESRDHMTIECLAKGGLGTYLDTLTKATENKEVAWRFHDASIKHPPLHYWLFALLAGEGGHSLLYYRLWIIPMLVLATVIFARWSRREGVNWLLCVAILSLLANFTYLRNYTFIRLGNEFLSFLGFSLFLLCVYTLYRSKASFASWPSLLGLVAFQIALFSKFSTVVAAVALLGSTFTVSIFYRDKRLAQIFAYTLACFFIGGTMYVGLFSGSQMFEMHVANYASKIFHTLRLPMPAAFAKDTVLHESTSSLAKFTAYLPIWYGPVVLLGLVGAVIAVFKTQAIRNKETVATILFLALGFIGVLLVNPRAQYTAPLSFAVAAFIAVPISALVERNCIFRLSIIAWIFAITQTLISS